MSSRIKNILAAVALAVAILLVVILPTTARAAELEYMGEITFSAYWPHEDHYHNNFKGQPLTDLVDEIVACPTGSDLLGREIMILTPDGQLLRRRVYDTGCKPGRLDMLVAGADEMKDWGLMDCHVWIISE
jgi:hypothetical protein